MALPPVLLEPNTPRRFYRGGRRIHGFRGRPVPDRFDDHRPEDWLASTTRLFAEGGDGLTVLADGTTLVDALRGDADGWLGPEHLAEHGTEPGLLVKLLDAAERLPVHAHPDRAFAARHLGCAHGKTEAWLVLDAEPGAQVWLGFADDLPEDRLTALVDGQGEDLLGALNGFPVSRGDAVLVPAGQPHAIGAGVLVVELQEPTDFSVMLEHARFGIDPRQAWLGLDRATALGAVDRHRLPAGRLGRLHTRWDSGSRAALPREAAGFFRAEVLHDGADDPCGDAGFSVVVVADGTGELVSGEGHRLAVSAGDVVLTPYACGDVTLHGPVTAIRCRPPAASPLG